MQTTAIARVDLEGEIASLEEQLVTNLAQRHQIEGALRMARHLLAKLDKPPQAAVLRDGRLPDPDPEPEPDPCRSEDV